MTTYAIAYTDTAIWATVPMTDDYMAKLEAEVRQWEDHENQLWGSDDLRIETNVVLIDEVSDDDDIVFASGHGSCGWIIGEDGQTYEYAVAT